MKNTSKIFIQLEGQLFKTVQSSGIFDDSKLFVDSIPKNDPETIKNEWDTVDQTSGDEIKQFVEKHFKLPGGDEEFEFSDTSSSGSMRDHIQKLWPHLFRKSHSGISQYDSLLPLPEPYVVPGGRFREIYYWDSYFTAQGLIADGHQEMALAMTRNFHSLIQTVGHIPNGNRHYYLSRSQPPFFAQMVKLVESMINDDEKEQFLDSLIKEHQFWMDDTGEDNRRTVKVDDLTTLNRYWDDNPVPRQESYSEDAELVERMNRTDKENVYRHIRAACESGWDFSSRWFADAKSLQKIETTNIVPVDLNCLMYILERQISEMSEAQGLMAQSSEFAKYAEKRKNSINRLMWDSRNCFYFDLNIEKEKQTGVWSLAGVYPLYAGIASNDQAAEVAKHLESLFLKSGGLVTTPNPTGQQWDFPNGWAPLQWTTIIGLQRYGYNDFAKEIAKRWIQVNKSVFKRTGKMVEKYDVCNLGKEGGGGEYPLQDGFGWSNGIASALMDRFGIDA